MPKRAAEDRRSDVGAGRCARSSRRSPTSPWRCILARGERWTAGHDRSTESARVSSRERASRCPFCDRRNRHHHRRGGGQGPRPSDPEPVRDARRWSGRDDRGRSRPRRAWARRPASATAMSSVTSASSTVRPLHAATRSAGERRVGRPRPARRDRRLPDRRQPAQAGLDRSAARVLPTRCSTGSGTAR